MISFRVRIFTVSAFRSFLTFSQFLAFGVGMFLLICQMNTSVSHWSIADPSDIKGVFMIDGRPKGLDEWKIFRFSNFTQGIIAKINAASFY